MLKKNSVVEIEITDINADAFGIGRHEGVAIFVPDAAIGDVMKVKIVKVLSSYCFGIVEKLITASSDRIEIDCPVFEQCGGCSLRHITYESELAIKNNWVEQNLNRIGKLDVTLPPIVAAPSQFGYRNKAQLPVSAEGENVNIGFFQKRSHRVVNCDNCLIQPPIFAEITAAIKEFIIKYNVSVYDETTKRGLMRHIYLRHGEQTDKIMLCLVLNGVRIPHTGQFVTMIRTRFPNITSIILNVNRADTNVILGPDNILLFGEESITDVICGITVSLSPLAFYQINRSGAEILYGIAKEFADLKPEDVLVDLYCGAGVIGLSMASEVKEVVGIEIVAPAVENARLNAKHNNIENARFIAATAAAGAAELLDQGVFPTVVVLDPPRKGCDEVTLDVLGGSLKPERIVYISCNSATLARDIEILCSKYGYEFVKAQAMDMFPRTGHVESVVLLKRRDFEGEVPEEIAN